MGKGLDPILSNWHPLDCIQNWRTRTLQKEEKIKIQQSAYTPLFSKKKIMGLLEKISESKLQSSAVSIEWKILFFFYIDNFERSNPDIIDSSCGLHVRKIKYAFALLSRRKWSLDHLKQEMIHLWRQKEVILTLLPFHGFAKFLNRRNLKDCRVQKKSKLLGERNICKFSDINSFENLSIRLLLARKLICIKEFPGTIVSPLFNKLSEIIPWWALDR